MNVKVGVEVLLYSFFNIPTTWRWADAPSAATQATEPG